MLTRDFYHDHDLARQRRLVVVRVRPQQLRSVRNFLILWLRDYAQLLQCFACPPRRASCKPSRSD